MVDFLLFLKVGFTSTFSFNRFLFLACKMLKRQKSPECHLLARQNVSEEEVAEKHFSITVS